MSSITLVDRSIERMVEFNPQMRFVEPSRFDSLWEVIGEEVRRAREIEAHEHLERFTGLLSEHADFQVVGLHHVAVYLGDYSVERQVESWHSYLEHKLQLGELRMLDRGPSYIAPKEYGTQGWWWVAQRADHLVIEMFTCHAYGAWGSYAPDKRYLLMSHQGLRLAGSTMVLPALESLARLPGNKLIAYVEHDQEGCTYGHVRQERSNRVIELLYQH